MAVELGSGVLASFLASNAAAINATTAAVGTAAAGAGANALLTKQPDKPKLLSNPDPDDKKKRLDTERDLARRYSQQGRVSSLFNKDKLG